MTKPWPKVRLGEVLQRVQETTAVQPNREYQELTIRLWGKGVVLRGAVSGPEITSARRYVVHSGQFILSRIDARNGAFGLVPDALDGAIVSNDFPAFEVRSARLFPGFLKWMSRTASFVDMCAKASEGTTNRVRLSEEKFLSLEIPLPPLAEQKRIVAQIEELAARIHEVRSLRDLGEQELRSMLLGAFRAIAANAPRRHMREVAPIVRRPIEVRSLDSYPELGIRSFGKGTFHKPALSGLEIGNKRIFRIEPGDLLFSNVFAWEGAVAVAKPSDVNRVGSHRFITCVPTHDVAIARFLCFFFLTQEGLDLVGAASPGGAGRNRTLGLSALEEISVPVPAVQEQKWFECLLSEVDVLRHLQTETAAELDALIPSVLEKAFTGGL